MSPTTLLLTALSSLAVNKLRAGLTLLGIVIGISAVITLMAIGQGVQQSITSRIESLGTNFCCAARRVQPKGRVRRTGQRSYLDH